MQIIIHLATGIASDYVFGVKVLKFGTHKLIEFDGNYTV